MSRRRQGPGRVTPKGGRMGQTASGLHVPREALNQVEQQVAMGLLQPVRERECTDPRCEVDHHVEYLCRECTARDGMPRYHLEPDNVVSERR